MKINWKLRLKNKTTLVALITAVIAFCYQIAGIFGLVVPVGEDAIVQAVGLIVNLLCAIGIVVDPTTEGVGDSERAMAYEKPRGDE